MVGDQSVSNPYQATNYGAPAKQPVNGWGIAGFVTSIIGLLTCGLLNIISLPVSLVGLCFKPRGFAIAGTVISCLGCALLALLGWGIVAGILGLKQVVTEAGKGIETVAALGEATAKIEAYRAEHNMLPDGIEGNKLIIDRKDAWGQSLRYELSGSTYIIRSAGPDQQFDTPDDLKSNEHQADTNITIEGGGDGMPEGPIVIPPDSNTTPTPEAPPGEGSPKVESEKESE
jgi:hypothetical protein